MLIRILVPPQLQPNSTIIEPTAGNTGIGLALVARQKNYKVIFTVPAKFSKEKQVLMKSLGATIIHTPTEEGMEGAIKKAFEIKKSTPNSFIPQQFSNSANTKAHYETTGREIHEQMNKKVDIFVAGVGTGGTFSGAAKYLKEQNQHLIAIAVQPSGSVLDNQPSSPHKTEGIGIDNVKTSVILDHALIDEVITVQDKQAHEMVKHLAANEGILVGSSSGAAAFAALKISERFPNKRIATIFPDGADRYLSKNLLGDFNEWKI